MATIINLVCENCNKEFEVKKGKEKKTCSKKCRWELRKRGDEKFYITKPCEICKKDFKSKKKENKKYCSYKCSGIAKKENAREMRTCKQCGSKFEERKKYIRNFCSNNCRLEWNSLKENKEKRLEKIKQTNLKRYGAETIFQTEKFKKELSIKLKGKINNKNALIALENKRRTKLIDRFNELGYEILNFDGDEIEVKHPDGHIFKNNRKLLVNRLNHSVELSTKLLPISAPRSTLELFVTNLLDEYGVEYFTNDRTLLYNNEIDVLIPNKKICIELNGLFWHSEYYINKNYHLDKLEKCDRLGYNLLHLFEDEIIEKPNIVKSLILNKLGLTKNKIYGRKCEIRNVSSNDSKNFLDKNHMQGNVNSKFKLGLYHNDELVSLMTFGKKRIVLGSKSVSNEYELLRFCNKLDTTVIGGASKLLKHFIKNYNPKEIISYANRRYSNGNLYEQLGFINIGSTTPNYFYVINKKREHRFKYRKDVLVSEGYDKNKSEHQIMLERKIPRIYDCGNFKYKKTTQ